MIKIIRKFAKRQLARFFGYTITIHWGRRDFTHQEMTIDECMDWLAQYPLDCQATLSINTTGYVLARRIEPMHWVKMGA